MVAPAFSRFGDCRSKLLAELRIDDGNTAHTNVHASVAPSIARRTPCPSPSNRETNITMVPKPQGQAIQSVTHRPLPPLEKLRVRRPNKPETNPCLGAMSSVLGRCDLGGALSGLVDVEEQAHGIAEGP